MKSNFKRFLVSPLVNPLVRYYTTNSICIFFSLLEKTFQIDSQKKKEDEEEKISIVWKNLLHSSTINRAYFVTRS